MMRVGDTVHHKPSNENWIVAAVWETTGDMAWCGWPEGRARRSSARPVQPQSH